ncbi:MAG: energy-coupling factor ABC transporter substrate-binding protein [Bryobacterales bacterium]|nr:energy-coupling factor ABC transporter substrate-binding protein [Bryobacterales bacterium]
MRRAWIAAAAALAVFAGGWWAAELASGTAGSDESAMQVVEQLSPGYEPWMSDTGLTPDPARERLLFAFQAGAGALLFAVGVLWRGARTGRREP